MSWLSLAIWLPILGGLAIIALGDQRSRNLALAISVLTLLVSLPLYFDLPWRLPDHDRTHGRCIQRARCHSVLHLL